jgi:hypothetical protein
MLLAHPNGDFVSIGHKATCASTLWAFNVKANNLSKYQENLLWEECSEGLKSDHTALVNAKFQGLIFYNLMKKMGIF